MEAFLRLAENFNFGGVSFVSIRGYSSDKSENSEVADVIINVGASYENMKVADLATLQGADSKALVTDNFGLALIEQAIAEKIQSIVKPSEARSSGQTEAYVALNKAGTIKLCKATRSILISGSVIKKTVLKAGVFKSVNSKPLTLAKKHIEKVLDLKLAKLRYYKLANIGKVKVNGDTIEMTEKNDESDD